MILLLILVSVTFSLPKAVVSAYPFYDVVRLIGEGRFETAVLVPPTVDYHLYELSASEILKLAEAEVVFVSGVPLGGWERKVEDLAKGKVYRLSSGIKLIPYGERGNFGKDPHLWLSPKRMIAVAKNAYKGFSKVDPNGKEVFGKNLETVLMRLSELDRDFERVLGRCRIKTLPVVHPALTYLAEDYGLEQIALSQADVHGGVLPKELLGFLRTLKDRNINFILAIRGKRSKLAELLKDEYGFKVFYINARLVPVGKSKDYFSIMKENLDLLRKVLRCM